MDKGIKWVGSESVKCEFPLKWVGGSAPRKGRPTTHYPPHPTGAFRNFAPYSSEVLPRSR
jgi:hypothetical protein